MFYGKGMEVVLPMLNYKYVQEKQDALNCSYKTPVYKGLVDEFSIKRFAQVFPAKKEDQPGVDLSKGDS